MTRLKTNAILADLIDVVSQLNMNVVAKGTGRRASKVKPYQRPDNSDKHFGKGAMTHSDLEAWFERKRKQHAGD